MQEDYNEFPFKSLEELYTSKKYDEGLDLLLKHKNVLSKGDFHYNMGTVYAKKADLPVARYHFEKSIKEGNVSVSSYNNLDFTIKTMQVSDLSTSYSRIDNLNYLLTITPFDAFISLSLIIIGLSILIGKYTKIKYGKIAVLFSIIPMLVYGLYVKNLNPAIVLKPLIMKEGPSMAFDDLGELSGGEKVLVSKNNSGWFLIESPKFLRGWVQKDQLGFY